MPDLLTEAFVRIRERLMGRADKVLRNGTEAKTQRSHTRRPSGGWPRECGGTRVKVPVVGKRD